MKKLVSVVARIALMMVAVSSFWLAAGRWDLPFAWAYGGLWFT